MLRRLLFLVLALTLPALAQEAPLERIGFGSCVHQFKPQLIWKAVAREKPDLFVLLGDNIYGDTTDMRLLAHKYEVQRNHPDFSLLKQICPVVGTWDDHDYGLNDSGREYPHKQESKRLMLEFFEEPADSPRWMRDGVYTSYILGPPGRRVQLILLDNRWNRSPLSRLSRQEARLLNQATGKGPYLLSPEPAEILGQAQWEWLEEELKKPAEIRLIGSSIPVIQDGTGWETWENFPAERERLYKVLNQTKASGVILLTGDSHRAEFSRVDDKLPYHLWELNSSGLSENALSRPPNTRRLGGQFIEDNFGLVRIDWEREDPQISLEIRDIHDHLVMQNTLRLSELQFGNVHL